MDAKIESNTQEFWNVVNANHWEGECFTYYHLRMSVLCEDGNTYHFNYWPKTRKIQHLKGGRIVILQPGGMESWIRRFINTTLKTKPKTYEKGTIQVLNTCHPADGRQYGV